MIIIVIVVIIIIIKRQGHTGIGSLDWAGVQAQNREVT